MSFEIYDELYEKSLNIKQIDPFIEDKINILDRNNTIIFYMLVLHYKNLHREMFDVKSKFPYGMTGTDTLIHGSISRFPIDLQRIIQAFINEVS